VPAAKKRGRATNAETGRRKEVKEAKEVKEVKEVKEAKEVKEVKEASKPAGRKRKAAVKVHEQAQAEVSVL
jgi:hypothetical protein